jgi:hypothetical protein
MLDLPRLGSAKLTDLQTDSRAKSWQSPSLVYFTHKSGPMRLLPVITTIGHKLI